MSTDRLQLASITEEGDDHLSSFGFFDLYPSPGTLCVVVSRHPKEDHNTGPWSTLVDTEGDEYEVYDRFLVFQDLGTIPVNQYHLDFLNMIGFNWEKLSNKYEVFKNAK